MNRYYPPSLEEVWESFEWLIKERLRDLDNMARRMFTDMQATHTADNEKIRAYMQEQFALVWEQVAAEQEVKTKRRERE